MFTVCPKCALTLVVTAADLRVAQGYVRCGRCSSVFNALAQLSDERSATPASESEASPAEPQAEEPESAPPGADDEPGESATLALADEEPRRSAPSATADAEQPKRSAPPAAADDESVPEYTLEFNPESTDAASLFVVAAPSPEWTAATGSFKELLTPEPPPATTAPETKAQDSDQDFEVELDAALLSDIVQSELTGERPVLTTREAPAPAAAPAETAAPPAPARPATVVGTPAPAAARTPADTAGRAPPAAAATATASTARTASATPARTPAATTARTTGAAAAPTPAGTPPRTPSVTVAVTPATTARTPAPATRTPAATAATPPAAAARTPPAPAAKTPAATPAKSASATETPAAPRGDPAADPLAPAPSGDVAFADFEAAAGATEEPASRPQWQWAAGSVLLILILFAQIINHQRDALATDPRFGRPLTAVYTALGVQLTPRWDLRAYDVRQLGATVEAGSTGAITVRASIRNAGSRPQPLPMLRVTLQDRFGNRLASRDVVPRDYMPSGSAPAALLAKDQRIDAELAFVDPGASAVGFELDACLPLGGGTVCANDTSAR
jgi:predicted Zn finger-like uncharacterized protein